MKIKDLKYCSTTSTLCAFLLVLNLLRITHATITTSPVPECAKSGIRMGAGLGALAGGTAGAALISHIGVGSMTLATCPTLALTTMAGAGTGILGGPLVPIGGLLAGAFLGGVAGGTTGGIVACDENRRFGDSYTIQYVPYHHPEGYKLQIANDGSYKPISGYNHHVHPTPHPAFDEMPESFHKPVSEIPKDYQHGLFRTEIDEFERKPFFVHTPTPRTFLTKIDGSYPPLYYSGSPSSIAEHYTDIVRGKEIPEKHNLPSKPGRMLFRKNLKRDSRKWRQMDEDLGMPSQNRMDEMVIRLANHNATLNRLIDYKESEPDFSNKNKYFYRTHFDQSDGRYFPEKTKLQKIYKTQVMQDTKFGEKHSMKNHIISSNSAPATSTQVSRKPRVYSQYFQYRKIRPNVISADYPFIPSMHDSFFAGYPEVEFNIRSRRERDNKKNSIFINDGSLRQRSVANVIHKGHIPRRVLVSKASMDENAADNTFRIRQKEDNEDYVFKSKRAGMPLSAKNNPAIKPKLASILMPYTPDELKHVQLQYLV